MASRIVKDVSGREWTCVSTLTADGGAEPMGKDVELTCTTSSVTDPVKLFVGFFVLLATLPSVTNLVGNMFGQSVIDLQNVLKLSVA